MPDAVQKMNPPTLPDAGAMGYSQIAITDAPRLAFVSGQIAQTADGAPVPEDLASQVPVVMANVGHALDALGATADDVVSVRAYVVDLDPAKGEVALAPFAAMFGGQAPAVTGVGIVSLASPELLLEVELVVALP